MGKLLCEKNLRDVWCRNESVRAEIGPILQTHTRVSFSSTYKLLGEGKLLDQGGIDCLSYTTTFYQLRGRP